LDFSPIALEMLDATVVSPDKKEEVGCLLYAEFAGDSYFDVEGHATKCQESMIATNSGQILEYASDEHSMTQIWSARKSALGNVMKLTVGSRRPVGLIEDTVVRPEMLSAHIASLISAYRDYQLDYVMYGHIGDGNIHTRPLVDMASKAESHMIHALATHIFAQVISAGGTITGEHGDGISRVGYIEQMYGKRMTALFRNVKELFDPSYLLNPGKKVPFKTK
jgi:FAD/FMN-containing dehydrogenase